MSVIPEMATDGRRPLFGTLVSVDGRSFPLLETRAVIDARGGLARVQLEQLFENPFDDLPRAV